jgi:hypothetical protein
MCEKINNLSRVEMNMTRSPKVIGVLAVALAIIGVMLSAIGLSGGIAATSHSKVVHTSTISPEELTRVAAPMPVHDVGSYQ